MIGTVIKLLIVLAVGLVGYNYLFGTAEEKAQSRAIVGKVADTAKAGLDLLKSEYQKFRGGKYDNALDKIAGLVGDVKAQGGEALEEAEQWNAKRAEWQQRSEALDKQMKAAKPEQAKQLADEAKTLAEQAKALQQQGKALHQKYQQAPAAP